MIAAVQGRLEAVGPDHAVVSLGGISLRVQVPASTLSELGSVGEEVKLHTHLYVREDHLALYGFLTPDELRLFELLLSVSGIGPRGALSLLSALPPDALQAAISNENVDALCRIPGVGRKTAGRIVLELKGKVRTAATEPALAARSADAEILTALTSLGYSTAEAQAALSSIQAAPDTSLEDRLLLALRFFAQRS